MQSSKKKILFTTYDLSIGGIEKALVNLVNNIDYTKYDVSILLQNKSGDLLKYVNPEVNVEGYNLSKISLPPLRKAINLLKMIFIYFKHYNKYDFSACYGTGYVVSSKMALGASKNNAMWMHSNVIRFVASATWIKSRKNNLEERTKGFIKDIKFRKFKHNFFVSNDAIKAYLSLYPEDKDKVELCHNYVDGNDIIKKSNEKVNDMFEKNPTTLINISRHTEFDKKLSRIINAAERLKKDGYKFKIVMIGDGDDSKLYRKKVLEKKLDDVIIFYGKKSNPFPYLKNSDAFVMCSEFEGFPTTFTESMTLNIPIITTNVSDAETVIKDKYGIVVDNNDNDIYFGIKQFLDEGFKISKRFSYKEYNKESLNKIYSLIDNNVK